jgi:hypothetical protein
MKNHVFIGLSLLLPMTAFAADDWPDVTEEGLHRVEDSKLSVVYADPDANLSPYQKVNLLDAEVAFRKNWERDQRTKSGRTIRVTSSDIERIKADLAALMNKEFTKALEEGGYSVTDEVAEDVLLVRPAIINLDVNAPDTMRSGRSRTYTQSAGEMTLYIELYDSVTGDLLVKALDRQKERNASYYTWSNSVTNRAAATRIVKGWAEILAGALDEARSDLLDEKD